MAHRGGRHHAGGSGERGTPGPGGHGRIPRPLTSRAALAALLLVMVIGGSGPAPAAAAPTGTAMQVPASTDDILAGMTRRQKVGQLFLTRVYGASATDPGPAAEAANRAALGVADADALVRSYHVGSIVYFGWAGNLGSPEAAARLSNGIQRAARAAGDPGVLISTDQEHGIVVRLETPATMLPGSMPLGATRSARLARSAARITGEELGAVGIGQDLAPVADVNSNPANPVIGLRAFGSEPGLVSSMVAAQVRGFQDDAGVVATLKHFPGHGDASVDSHSRLPVIDRTRAEWEAIDAPPFIAGIAAGAGAVMTAHIAVPSLDPSGRPATLSAPIITGILRGELGYDGVVLTDSLGMGAVRDAYGDRRIPVLALRAGVDILSNPPNLPVAFRAVMDAIRSGELSMERIDRSVRRILALKARFGLLAGSIVDPGRARAVMDDRTHDAVATAVARRSVTLLRNRAGLLPLDSGADVLVTGWASRSIAVLPGELRRRGLAVTVQWTGTDPGAAAIDAAVARAKGKDAVVLLLGASRMDAGQTLLAARLAASGTPLVVVAANLPYHVRRAMDAAAIVATYSGYTRTMVALAAVLTGGREPVGRLPVTIRANGRVQFPFGAGLGF